jgi:hypothetical protein
MSSFAVFISISFSIPTAVWEFVNGRVWRFENRHSYPIILTLGRSPARPRIAAKEARSFHVFLPRRNRRNPIHMDLQTIIRPQ